MNNIASCLMIIALGSWLMILDEDQMSKVSPNSGTSPKFIFSIDPLSTFFKMSFKSVYTFLSYFDIRQTDKRCYVTSMADRTNKLNLKNKANQKKKEKKGKKI